MVRNSYYCNGYVGYNCEFDCYDPDGEFECDFDTGEKFCVDIIKFNPPKCKDKSFVFNYLVTRECKLTENKCQNNANCTVVDVFNTEFFKSNPMLL